MRSLLCEKCRNQLKDNENEIEKTEIERLPLSALLVDLHDDSEPTSMRHLRATIAIRKLISDGDAHQIQHVVRSTAVQRLVALLARESHCECFQREFALIATHLAPILHGKNVLIQFGAVPALVLLLRSHCHAVREPALIAVSLIARDSLRARDVVLSYDGAMQSVLDAVVDMSWSELGRGVDLVVNLCTAAPAPRWYRVRPAMPVLIAWLEGLADSALLVSLCAALANVARDGTSQQLAALVAAAPRLVELLAHESIDVVASALECVNILVLGPFEVAQVALDHGVLRAVVALLQRPDAHEDVGISALSVLRCILDGDGRHVAALVDAGAVAAVGRVAPLSDAAAGATCVFLTAVAMHCNSSQQKRLVKECDFVRVLLSVAHCHAELAVECLRKLLSPTDNFFLWAQPKPRKKERNVAAEAVVRCGGVEVLEQLRLSTKGAVQAVVEECLEEVYSTSTLHLQASVECTGDR